MRVVGVAWQGYGLPFRAPYVTSEGRAAMKYGLLVFLRGDGGLVGVGDASPVGPGNLSQVQQLVHLMEDLAPQIIGLPFALAPAIEEAKALTNLSALGALPALAFGLETARLDLLGKAQGNSVAELLGGAPRSLPVNAIIASDSPAQASVEAFLAVAAGFASLKLKVGQPGLEQDIKLVSAVRQAIGASVRLRLDPNQAWTASQAVVAIRRLAAFGVEYVEQPVVASNLAGMAQVRRETGVLVAADEALTSAAEVDRILLAEAADLFILKAARLGGLATSLEAAHAAAKAGKISVVTSSLESGVGLAASAHLASALAPHTFAHGLATGLLYDTDLLEHPLLPIKGMLPTPSGPGLGVTVDSAQLSRYGIGITGGLGLSAGV